MNLVNKIATVGSLIATLYSGCARYTRMNVYYTLDGTGKVNTIQININEYKKFLWFQKENNLLKKDSTLAEPLPIRTIESIFRGKGIKPEFKR